MKEKVLSTKINKFYVSYLNEKEFHLIKREIFAFDCYKKDFTISNPYIIDIGAHIGLFTLYYKDLYPESDIVALEPHPLLFETLSTNILQNNLQGVTLINKCLDTKIGHAQFYYDNTGDLWLSNGSLLQKGWNNAQENTSITVETTTLDQLLRLSEKNVDLLKLDIEGIEQKIIKDNLYLLNKVNSIIVEFHPAVNQDLRKLLQILRKARYHTYVYDDGELISENARLFNDYKSRLLIICAER